MDGDATYIRAGLLLILPVLASCYGCGGRDHLAGDVTTDTRVDPPPDAPPDIRPDEEPLGWVFIDRDDPDRITPVDLLFSTVPDAAWNGTSVGLVYHGMVSGGHEAVGFIPMDERGIPTGPESVLIESSGLTSAFPRIAHAGDGTFLVCVVQEMRDRVVMLRVSRDGDILDLGESDEMMSLSDLLSPPVRIGDHAFTATQDFLPESPEIVMYQFSYPDLVLEATGWLTGDLDGHDPILVEYPHGSGLQVFFLHAHSAELAMAGIDPSTLEPDGSFETFDTYEPLVHHASSSSSGWYAWTFTWYPDSGRLRTWWFDPTGSGEDIDTDADFYNPIMDSVADEHPAWGAVRTLMRVDEWHVDGLLYAVHPDWGLVWHFGPVNDRIGDRDVTDSVNATIAWTGNGFLVVWDEWRPDATQALFSSYVELAPVY
jgi:hypothetical protein